MKSIALILLAFGTCLPSLADRSNSGITGPSYASILKDMERLRETYPGLVQLKDYGRSVQGRTLRMMIVSKPSLLARRPALLMTGSTHGNEYLNLEDRIPEEVLKLSSKTGPIARFINGGGAYIFVPILNPDGYEARSRFNANRVDLNRDWDVGPASHKGFKEVETRVLAETLKSMRKDGFDLAITVDYHCCIGALLHPWSYTTGPLPKSDLNRHISVGNAADKVLNIDVGTTPEILGYAPLGTTKDYYYAEYGALAFTYEGRYKKENQYLSSHVAWWQHMSEMIAREIRRPVVGTTAARFNPLPLLAE